MATYTELHTALTDPALLVICEVAIVIAAQGLMDGGGATAEERRWARQALYSPGAEAKKALTYMVAKYKTAAIGTILGADEAVIQPEVDAIVPALVAGMAGL